jgi:formylglycine-generating enzyme required for sulfatase activity
MARLDDFDAKARELLASFLQWRLLVAKEPARANQSRNGDDGTTTAGHGGVSTVEVAHEAIFRGWHRFKGWLEPLKADLETLRGLETAARVWDRHGRKRVFLDHRSHRLKAAKRLLDHFEFKNKIGTTERAYLDAASSAQGWGRVAALAITTAFVALLVAVLMWRTYEFSTQNKVTWYGALRVWAVKAGFSSLAAPEMIELPAGTFVMGSPENERGHQVNESPQREVNISAFAIGKYEVTMDDWMVCALAGGCDRISDNGWGGGRRPVINVGWDDAKAYVRWLTEVTGDTYRLPTEAEWEYAARAGTTTAFALPAPKGSDDITAKGLANCRGCGSDWDGRSTAPVGSFPPNAFGLYDMHGNVWEFVEACQIGSHEGAPKDGRVASRDCGRLQPNMRGGSWYYIPEGLRSAFRGDYNISDRLDDVGDGFRVAKTLR